MTTQTLITKFERLRSLLTEGYQTLQEKARENPDIDFTPKSDDGVIDLHFVDAFHSTSGYADHTAEPSVTIWAYALGPHRCNHFYNLDEAIDAVRKWIADMDNK